MIVDLLNKDIKKVTAKYGWLNVYSIVEDQYDEKWFRDLKNKISKDEIQEMLRKIEKNKTEFKQLISKIKDRELKIKVILMHEYAFLRDDRVDIWKKFLLECQPFFLYLASKFKNKDITLKTASNLTPDEIKGILDGNIPSIKELRKRENQFIYYYDNKLHIITDQKEIEKIKDIVSIKSKDKDVIKGNIANKGKVSGKVVIINSINDLKKVKKGNIMICTRTDPRFTIYMKKCKAIVADEGGILSHAALTARELGIPCLIGANIATKVLKDGDYVEVDADKGVVRRK